MPTIKTNDGTEIHYQSRGRANRNAGDDRKSRQHPTAKGGQCRTR